ncbi:conserved hypothetical protein [Roseovarius sp. EC-SD190]|nr:conserved hypothetical protein [Roseovarius sp. EC-SD190]
MWERSFLGGVLRFGIGRGRGQVALDRGGQAHEHAGDCDQLVAQLGAGGHAVEHAVIQQVFGALKALGQFLADGLFDDARPGKADERARFGNLDIAQHRIGCGDAAGGGVGQHDDIGQVRLFQHLHGDGGAGHLHEAENPLLHARATGGGKEDERALELNGCFGGGDDGIAHIHAHGPGHEAEILCGGDDGRAAHFAGGDEHRLFLAGGLLGGAQAVGVFLLVAEMQRVGGRGGHVHLGEDAAVKQPHEAGARGDAHVVAAVGADVEIVREFAVEQHGSAFVAFGPEVFGDFAAREDRVDPRAHVIGDPVHRVRSLW